MKFDEKKSAKVCIFAPHLEKCSFEKEQAAIAQLVERDLAKVEVAGPSPVCRSIF